MPSEDSLSSANTFDLGSTQTYPAADQWDLPQDFPNPDLSFVDASCSDHADEATLPQIAKLRSRAPNTGGICAPGGSEPEWQDNDDDIHTGVVNPDPEFPIMVFPDVMRNGLSSSICDKYSFVVMYPVCDSGSLKDRSISLIFWNPTFPLYKLNNCNICTFFRSLSPPLPSSARF